MVEIMTRCPVTGTASDAHFWFGDRPKMSEQACCELLLDDARGADSTGYGVEMVARIGGCEIRQGFGPTPYESDDGSARCAWLDLALVVLRTAIAYEALMDQTR